MTPLRVFRKTTPLVNAIRLSLLPLAGLSFSAFAAQVNIAPGSLDKALNQSIARRRSTGGMRRRRPRERACAT